MVHIDRPLKPTDENMQRLEDEPWLYTVNGIDLTVTKPHDPAQVLLQDPNVFSTKQNGVLDKDDCFICLDPEFAQMGMPLCYPCPVCQDNPEVPHAGHVPADDTICTECGTDAEEVHYRLMEAECADKGHDWKTHPAHEVNGIAMVDGRIVVAPQIMPEYTGCQRCRKESS